MCTCVCVCARVCIGMCKCSVLGHSAVNKFHAYDVWNPFKIHEKQPVDLQCNCV